jgi:hypothetical protein
MSSMHVGHPVKKNDDKRVILQTFWNGILKVFNMFTNKLFKGGKTYAIHG